MAFSKRNTDLRVNRTTELYLLIMDLDLVIKNGKIITAESTREADVGIRGEEIAAIGPGLSGQREIDATGKLVTPGAIDNHVHLEMPIGDFVSADSFLTGTRAAACGGTTTIIDFVEPRPAQSMTDALKDRVAVADGGAVIDYGFHMTIGPHEIDKLDQVPAAVDAGCASFKMYMAYGLRLNDGQMLRALEAVGDSRALPVVHAENWDVICALAERNVADGNTHPQWHPRSRPAELEGEAVGRVIDLAAFAGTPVFIFHVSTAHAVERIAAARQRGVPVYAETCPQYLFLTDEVFERPGVEGALPVCSPPIRDEGEQASLWSALCEDALNVVSTDHCPFTTAEKATGLDNYTRIPGGVPSIEMRFPAIYSAGVRTGRFSANRWVDMCCTTPARVFGLERKGQVAVGHDADLVVFDPERQVELSTTFLHEEVDWTPYEGMSITGWPEITISRGEIIADNGAFLGQPGRGEFVRRAPGRF